MEKTQHLVCLGELLVDFFPNEIGCTLPEVTAFYPKPGGAPANVAVAASRLGISSAFIGKVGDDPFGHFLAGILASENVNTSGLRFDPQFRTTLAFLSQPDVQSYECLFYRNPGADICLRADELDRTLLQGTRALVCGLPSLSAEPVRSAAFAAVDIARQSGALICFDVNYRSNMWESPEEARRLSLEMISKVNLVKVNEGELALLGNGKDIPNSARALRAMGPEICVVTLGARGSYIQTAQGEVFLPAYPVETLDATGCGDAFLAALISKLEEIDWRNDPGIKRLYEILRYANAAGALTAQKRGVIPALPTASEVENFLQETP